ncbi:MAG: 4Fe-4S binding protein [Deltaproteobacteria bacterium]|nr:4Fe-4S binding protein [Deltaproteobacteria bacterium]
MPWVNKEMCTGCGICIDECTVGAISMDEDIAFIDEDKVEANLAWIRRFLEHDYYSGNKKRQKELIERMKRYFAKERKVAEKTIERIDALQDTGTNQD